MCDDEKAISDCNLCMGVSERQCTNLYRDIQWILCGKE